MKRILSAFLLLTVLICTLGGCAESESDKINLIIRVPTLTMENIANKNVRTATDFVRQAASAFAAQYKKYNITFTIETFDYSREAEAIVDIYDTDSATDILYEGFFNMQTYVYGGRVVPLDDVLDDGLRNEISDRLLKMGQTDGKTYMLPFLSSQNFFVYNKEIFKECGLEKYIHDVEIAHWSQYEWNIILNTLTEKLPDNSYAMMLYGKNENGDAHIMTLLRSRGCDFFDESGMVSLTDPEGIAALQWISDGIKKGWFPPHCENMEFIDSSNLFKNRQMAICATNNSSLHYFDGIDYGIANFPDKSGNGIVTEFVSGFEVFDNGSNAKIEIAKDFIKYVYQTSTWADCATSGVPASKKVLNKYRDKLFMIDELLENTANVVDFTNASPNWRGVRKAFYKDFQELLIGKTPAQVAILINKDCNAAISEGIAGYMLHD